MLAIVHLILTHSAAVYSHQVFVDSLDFGFVLHVLVLLCVLELSEFLQSVFT